MSEDSRILIPTSTAERPDADEVDLVEVPKERRPNIFERAGRAVSDFVADTGRRIGDFAGNAAHAVGDTVDDVYARGRDAVGSAVTTVKDAVTQPQTVQTQPPTATEGQRDVIKERLMAKAAGTDNGGNIDTAVESKPEYDDLDDVIRYMERRRAEIHIPTKEELEKERRRRRTEGIIAGIADGASAIANLIFTTKGAPDMSTPPGRRMSDTMRARYDRLKAERDAEADKFLDYSLRIANLKHQRGRDALQDRIRISQEERAQLKADRDAAMADLRMQLLAGRISEQDAATRAKEIEAQYAERYWAARVGNIESSTRRNNRAGTSGGSGGKRYTYYAQDEHGDWRSFTLSTTNKTVVENYAASHGLTLPQSWRESIVSDERDGRKHTRTTSYMEEPEEYIPSSDPIVRHASGDDNTPPSRRKGSNNDNTPPSRRK